MQNKFVHLKQLLSDGMVYGFVNALNKGLSFIIFPFITRILSTSDIGILGIATSMLSLFYIFSTFSMDSAVNRFYYDSKNEELKRDTFSTAFWIQIVLYFIVFPLIILVSLLLKLDQYSKLITYSFIVLVFINIIYNMGIIVTRVRRESIKFALISVMNSITLAFMLFILVFVERLGLEGYFYSIIISMLVSSTISLFIIIKLINPKYFNSVLLKKMFLYIIPIVPGTLAFWFVENSGILFAGFMGTTENAGIYKVGSTMSQIIMLLVFAFQQAWGPYALSIFKAKGSKDFFALVFKIYVLTTVIIATFLSIFSTDMLKMFFPVQYNNANYIVFLLNFGHVLEGLYYIGIIGMIINKNMKSYGMISFLMAILTLFGNIFAINLIGDTGPALIYLLVKIISIILIFYFAQKVYHIPYNFRVSTFVFSLGVLVSFLSNYLSNQFHFLKSIEIRLIVFLIFVACLSILNKDAIIKIVSFVKNKIYKINL